MRFDIRPGIRRLRRIEPRMRNAARADVDDELASVIAHRIDHLVDRGMSPQQAERVALERVGMSVTDALRTLHEVAGRRERQMRFTEWLDGLRQDLRYAVRGLARRPGFSALAIVTLAIGIGATTAIFSAVNTLLLRPLPYARPDELMTLSLVSPARTHQPGSDAEPWSYPKVVVFRRLQRVFSEVAPYSAAQFTVGTVDPERVPAEYVGATYLRTLGLKPVVGRDFDRGIDAAPGAPRQVLLSYALWQRQFGSDTGIVGRTVDINLTPYTVTGVAPPSFTGLTGEAQLFIPISTKSAADLSEPQLHEYWLVARRAPGITESAAMAAARLLGTRISEAVPYVGMAPWGAVARPLDQERLDPVVRRSVLILLGAVGLVLLIACVNVANLLLARASTRGREIGLRIALGAGRARLVRLLLTESILLAILGGAAGLFVALACTRAIASIDPQSALRISTESGVGAAALAPIHLDSAALIFALAVSCIVGVLFGLAPAITATGQQLAETLKESRVGGTTSRMRRALAIAQVALAIVLLAGSGLMIRSLSNLLATDGGFDPRGVLTFRIAIPPNTVPGDSLANFYAGVLDRVRAIPGVTQAALSNCTPLGNGCSTAAIQFLDRPIVAPERSPIVGVHWITPDWLSALHVPLRGGRSISTADGVGSQRVALVNEAAARTFWPGANPVGRQVSLTAGGLKNVTVIGIVGDVRQRPDSTAKPEVYIPFAQLSRPGMIVFLRSSRDLALLAPEVRRAVHDVAPRLPVYNLREMSDVVAAATAHPRFAASLLTAFAATALLLAAIGVYGVISLAVSSRTREIGVRIALGADGRRVRALVLREGTALAAAGTALGLVGALAITRVLQSSLFDLTPTDPVTYLSVVAVVLTATLAATWVPARRASSVDPVTALRAE